VEQSVGSERATVENAILLIAMRTMPIGDPTVIHMLFRWIGL